MLTPKFAVLAAGRDYIMSIQDIIEGKREWRAHMARVKALPEDYQIVYKEIQKYIPPSSHLLGKRARSRQS